MNILTVADCHGQLQENRLLETLAGRTPDVIFFLGDNDAGDIECVQASVKNVPMYGVIGNHDYLDILKDYSIEDLHMKIVSFDGFLIGGFGGTIKYKCDSSRLMFTNEESENLFAGFPKCDIMITHDRPCFRVEKHEEELEQEEKPLTLFQRIKRIFTQEQDFSIAEEDSVQKETEYEPVIVTAHSGITGIAQYIQEKRPSYHLHGHLHEPHIEMKYGTEIKCCFRTEFFTLDKNELR